MAKSANPKIIIDKSRIIESTMESVMHNSMMPYSEHVILDRALPRVEDGLKPVQRRILYTMMELGVTPEKPHKKCARIVGDCLGKYHPHGDSSVYGALVKLAQSYNTNMTLIDGHGNFGSIDGDNAAAMRYTEARLTPLALEMLRDLDKNTVDMTLNFDDTLEEPCILPGRFPNLLVNGASGIAVGMATNIPPHNLAEVVDGVVAYIDNSRITLDEMIKLIPAPDFPTAAWIVDSDEIKKSYATGRGRIVMRANTSIEKDGDKENIIIHELPYQVNKAELLKSINNLRESKKEIFGNISDILDESDRNGMRCIIKLRKDSDSAKILAGLYKATSMENGFSVNMVAICNGKPETLGLLDIIAHYVEHQRNIIYRRSQYELSAAKKRQHILEGLLKAVNNIREVIEIVLSSKTYTESKDRLKERFDLTEKQAIAVLDIPLKRLNKLDIGKMEQELIDLAKLIHELELILSSKRRQLAIVRKEILEIKKKHATPRKSKILTAKQSILKEIDLNAKLDRNGKLVLNHNGNLKFMSERGYNLASKSVVNCSENELAKRVINVDNSSNVIGWTAKGNAVVFNIDSLEDEKWKSRGTNISKITKVDTDDILIDIMPASQIAGKELYFYTEQGMIKKTGSEEYNLDKKTVYPAIILKEDDVLLGVEVADPSKEYVLFVTKEGMALNAEADIPLQGRKAAGVKGVQLSDGDKVIFASQNDTSGEVAVICDSGFCKRTLLPNIEPMRRYRKGVKLSESKTGNIIYCGIVKMPISLAVVMPDGECLELSSESIAIDDRTAKGKNVLKTVLKSSAILLGKCLENNII